MKPITNVGRNKTASGLKVTLKHFLEDLESSRAIPHIHNVALSRLTSIEELHIGNLYENICQQPCKR